MKTNFRNMALGTSQRAGFIVLDNVLHKRFLPIRKRKRLLQTGSLFKKRIYLLCWKKCTMRLGMLVLEIRGGIVKKLIPSRFSSQEWVKLLQTTNESARNAFRVGLLRAKGMNWTSGNRYLLNFVDYTTRFTRSYTVPTKTTTHVVKAIKDLIS